MFICVLDNGVILLTTQNIIRGGETNYISATVSAIRINLQHFHQPTKHPRHHGQRRLITSSHPKIPFKAQDSSWAFCFLFAIICWETLTE